MPFAIEALQSKAKLNNYRSRQFAQTLWPELRPKEDSTLVQAASHNIKSAVRALLARVKSVVDRSEEGAGSSAQGPEPQPGPATITADENDDGFLEINIVKRIRTGNQLLVLSTSDDEE